CRQFVRQRRQRQRRKKFPYEQMLVEGHRLNQMRQIAVFNFKPVSTMDDRAHEVLPWIEIKAAQRIFRGWSPGPFSRDKYQAQLSNYVQGNSQQWLTRFASHGQEQG